MRPFPRPDLGGVVLLLMLAGLGGLVVWGFLGYSYDDAFITYRYARNWAEGAGLVFNPGERVLGTTAPGFALLLGFLSAVTGVSVPVWGTLLAVGSLATVALVLRSALAGAPPAVRVGVPLLFAASAFLLQWNIEMLGAETFPVLAFGIASAHLALDRNRPVLAGALIFLAMACRLDAGLLAAILGLALWRQRRSFPWAFALAGLLPLAIYLGWLQATFGAIVPNTMAAKQAELELVEAGYSYTLREWRWLRRGVPLVGCVVLLGLALWTLVEGARAVWRRQSIPGGSLAAVLGLWLLGHEVAYRLLKVPFAPWYHVSLINGLLAAAALGAALVASRLPGRLLRLVGASVLLLPLLIPSAAWVVRQLGKPPDPRWTGYVEAALRIRETGGSVAAVEIGFLGYFSEARVLDLMGLVSPQALEARQRGDLAGLVARERPEYLLDVSAFRAAVLDSILADPEITGAYREVAVIEDERLGVGMRLLRRGSAPAPGVSTPGGPAGWSGPGRSVTPSRTAGCPSPPPGRAGRGSS